MLDYSCFLNLVDGGDRSQEVNRMKMRMTVDSQENSVGAGFRRTPPSLICEHDDVAFSPSALPDLHPTAPVSTCMSESWK
jgi:hypothetical protein